jgi:NADH/NAD ratio-sensing transcriptional regulator Rex
MLETLRQEYVVTARAKGLKESDVVNVHARKNALIPVATLGGFTVLGTESLPRVVRSFDIGIAIVCVPKAAAQAVALVRKQTERPKRQTAG